MIRSGPHCTETVTIPADGPIASRALITRLSRADFELVAIGKVEPSTARPGADPLPRRAGQQPHEARDDFDGVQRARIELLAAARRTEAVP